MCKPPGAIRTRPGITWSPFSASLILTAQSPLRRSAKDVVKCAGMCWTTNGPAAQLLKGLIAVAGLFGSVELQARHPNGAHYDFSHRRRIKNQLSEPLKSSPAAPVLTPHPLSSATSELALSISFLNVLLLRGRYLRITCSNILCSIGLVM